MKRIILALLLVMGVAMAADVQCWNGTAGAYVWYSHDNAWLNGVTSIDTCGVGNLTLFNGVTTGVAGVFNEAYDYEVADTEYANNDSNLPARVGNNVSVAFWLRPETEVQTGTYFTYGKDAATHNYIALAWYNNWNSRAIAIVRVGADYNFWELDEDLIGIGNTTHIIMVWGGTDFEVYVNDSLVTKTSKALGGTGLPDSANLDNPTYVTLGASWSGAAAVQHADIAMGLDSFSIHNKSLTASERSELFNNDRVGEFTPPAGADANVSNNGPTNNDHDSTAPTWQFTPTWNATIPIINCSLWANSTLRQTMGIPTFPSSLVMDGEAADNGTIADVEAVDLVYQRITEDVGGTFNATWNFTNLDNYGQNLSFTGYYDGNPAHEVQCWAFNYSSAQYEECLGFASPAFPEAAAPYTRNITLDQSNYYDGAGFGVYEASFRYYHPAPVAANHYMWTDYLAMVDIPINNTINNISWTPPSDGLYNWWVSCDLSNGNVVNSTAWDFTYDTLAPNVTITTPAQDGFFYYADSNNLNILANDTNMFNLSCDVHFSNSTFITNYTNDTGTPPDFTLANEFTSGLGCEDCDNISYYINCSAMDSHTGDNWQPDWVTVEDGLIQIGKNGKAIDTLFNWSATPSYDILQDRIKWSVAATADATGKVKVKFIAASDCPVYVINSEYAGHYVTCGMWSDFQDAEDEGYAVTVVKEDWNKVEIEIEKDGFAPLEDVIIDPATGGLNLGFALANFTVAVDSRLIVSWNPQYLGTTGFGFAAYLNISDNSHIANATCNYTITDPGFNVYTQNFTDEGAIYLANFTPIFLGDHNVTVDCNKTNWTSQSFSGTFNVLSAPPGLDIAISIEQTDTISDARCENETHMIIIERKDVTLGGVSETAVFEEYVLCEMGCEGNRCMRSIVRESGSLGLWLLIFVIIVAFIYLGRRWLK